MSGQRGAALLALIAVLFTVMAAAAVAALRPLALREAAEAAQQRALAQALDALRGAAAQRRCANRSAPPDTLLPCPEAGVEGVAAASCPGSTRGWLPWRTLGVPPLRDASGTCLWMERDGLDVRVVAPGAPRPGQSRPVDPARLVCTGLDDAAQYLDATDAAASLRLDATALATVCP